MTVAALRAAMALPIVYLLMRSIRLNLPNNREDFLAVSVSGIFLLVVPFVSIAWSQQYLISGLGGILYSVTPLFVIFFAHFLVPNESMTTTKIIGVMLGMGGVFAVVGPSIRFNAIGDHLIAQLVALLGPLAYAIGSIYVRPHRHIHPLTLTAGMFLSATLILVPISLVMERPWELNIDGVTWTMLFILAIVGTAIPAGLNYMLIQHVGVIKAGLMMFFMPLFAVLFGYLMLGERIDIYSFLGLAMILMGSFSIIYQNEGQTRTTVITPINQRREK